MNNFGNFLDNTAANLHLYWVKMSAAEITQSCDWRMKAWDTLVDLLIDGKTDFI